MVCTLLHIYNDTHLNFPMHIHAEPNPPTNLSAVMTCDAKGYKVYIEWKVYLLIPNQQLKHS